MNTTTRRDRRQVLGAALAAAAWALGTPAGAQAPWPAQPVKIIVPYPAGGSADIVGRLLARRYGEVLGQSFVVENRAGANGSLGGAAVAAAPADGYTLMVSTTGPLSLNKLLYKNTPYDPVVDYTPIALVADVPLLIAAHPSVPATTMAQLVAYMKANPGKLSFSTGGTASMGHLAGEMVQRATGASMVHVPYKGSALAMQDLLAGVVGLSIDLVPTYLQHIQAGKARAIAVLSPQRVASLPEVPTLVELGINATATGWFGVVGPKGLPQPIVARLNQITNEFLASAEGKEQLQKISVRPIGGPPEALGKFVVEELARWKPVIDPMAATIMQ